MSKKDELSGQDLIKIIYKNILFWAMNNITYKVPKNTYIFINYNKTNKNKKMLDYDNFLQSNKDTYITLSNKESVFKNKTIIKLFKKLSYSTTSDIINCIVHMRPGYIEYLLWDLKVKVRRLVVYLLTLFLDPYSAECKSIKQWCEKSRC
jgi:hypothetical protein